MAKQPPSKSGTARIRFIMVDAELPDGDLSQITAAIQNALKPAPTIIQQRLPTQPIPALPNSAHDPETELDGAPDDLVEDASEPEVTPRKAREARPRKPVQMHVLEIDLTSEVSFESFASQYTPKSEPERNLIVLAWFKEHRPDVEVTANHVYTCYRTVKWSVGFTDFAWPLRFLKKEQLATSPARGHYAINHLGIQRVEDMRASA